MPNPNPNISNLTNAGKGAPKKNNVTIKVCIPIELLNTLDDSIDRGTRSKLIERLLTDYLSHPKRLERGASAVSAKSGGNR